MKNEFLYHLSKFLNSYLTQTCGLSSNTIQTYSDTFKLLFIYAKKHHKIKPEKLTFKALNKEFILAFLEWIGDERSCKDSTRNLRLSNIKSFFSYLQIEIPAMVEHSQTVIQIPKKKTKQSVVDYISIQGIKLMLQQPNRSTNIGKKHLVLLSFMYGAGVRVQELIDVRVNDFQYNRSDVVRVVGKGNKARLIPLEKDLVEIMQKFIAHEKSKRIFFNPEDYLFVNQSNTPFTRQGIGYIIKKYADMARKLDNQLIPPKIHPHILRHSRAMALLQAGVELIYIRDFLGHYSVTTTEIYARVNNELTRQALLKVSPEETNIEVPIWNQDKKLLEFLKSLSQD